MTEQCNTLPPWRLQQILFNITYKKKKTQLKIKINIKIVYKNRIFKLNFTEKNRTSWNQKGPINFLQ